MLSFVGGQMRLGFRIVMLGFSLAWWCLMTEWEGAKALWRGVLLLTRLGRIFAETGHCPRGHTVPLYGVFECACHGIHEGWVFGKCRVCGQSAGWTPCPECQLPVLNPLRG